MKPSVFDFLTFFRHLIALFDIFHPMAAGGSIVKWSTLTWSDGIRTSRWSRNWSSHLSHVRSIQQWFCHSWICWIIQRGAKWRFLFWISNRCSHTKSSSDFAYFIASILRCLERNMVVLTKNHQNETSCLSQAHSCQWKGKSRNWKVLCWRVIGSWKISVGQLCPLIVFPTRNFPIGNIPRQNSPAPWFLKQKVIMQHM